MKTKFILNINYTKISENGYGLLHTIYIFFSLKIISNWQKTVSENKAVIFLIVSLLTVI